MFPFILQIHQHGDIADTPRHRSYNGKSGGTARSFSLSVTVSLKAIRFFPGTALQIPQGDDMQHRRTLGEIEKYKQKRKDKKRTGFEYAESYTRYCSLPKVFRRRYSNGSCSHPKYV